MLQTRRLSLRNFCPADAQTLFICRNDPRCSRHQRYGDTGIEALQAFVRDYAHSLFPSREEEQHYAVVRTDSGEMIGDLSVFYTPADRCFTLGITIAPHCHRQGFACELLGEVIARLRAFDPAAEIVALIERDNTPSIALFRKLGFMEECWAESIQSYVYTLGGNAVLEPVPSR